MNAQALKGTNTLDQSKVRKTNVIVYKTSTEGHGSHCIYLSGCDIEKKQWIGTNSWGKQQDDDENAQQFLIRKHPRVEMNYLPRIYDVVVTSCVLLQGSLARIIDGQISNLHGTKVTENMVLWGQDRVKRKDRVQDDGARRDNERLQEQLRAEINKFEREQENRRREIERLQEQ
eukprot:COSAG06_NODE_12797_length_1327_cov_1.505700_1_plen_173_part_10